MSQLRTGHFLSKSLQHYHFILLAWLQIRYYVRSYTGVRLYFLFIFACKIYS